MSFDLDKICCDAASSSSSDTRIFCDNDFNKCNPRCCCHSCCRKSTLSDHTYEILKRICNKLFRNYNRQKCREKYTVFNGGNSIFELQSIPKIEDPCNCGCYVKEGSPCDVLKKKRDDCNKTMVLDMQRQFGDGAFVGVTDTDALYEKKDMDKNAGDNANRAGKQSNGRGSLGKDSENGAKSGKGPENKSQQKGAVGKKDTDDVQSKSKKLDDGKNDNKGKDDKRGSSDKAGKTNRGSKANKSDNNSGNGDKGDKGDNSDKGTKDKKDDKGNKDDKGDKTDKNDKGDKDKKDDKGNKGDKGDNSAKGDKGAKGDAAVKARPSKDDDKGNKGIKDDKGNKDIKDTSSKGDKDAKGVKSGKEEDKSSLKDHPEGRSSKTDRKGKDAKRGSTKQKGANKDGRSGSRVGSKKGKRVSTDVNLPNRFDEIRPCDMLRVELEGRDLRRCLCCCNTCCWPCCRYC